MEKLTVHQDICKNDIDSYVNEVCNVLIESAKETFGTYEFNRNFFKSSQNSNQWFNADCRKARREFRKAQRLHRHYGSNLFKERLRQSEIYYKKVMDENIIRYNNEISNKMKTLKTKNPREFWKLFNRCNTRNKSDISINTLFDFFKELNKNKFENDPDLHFENDVNSESTNDFLNGVITADEIIKVIKKAKNNKSPGEDLIINEYIASTLDIMIDVYVYLFNFVFDTGILPEAWLIGNIIPVFKNKGNKFDAKNYKPITLLSCLGKVFTSILNNRLNDYLDTFSLLNENQAGFRQGYSTVDHIYSLYMLFQLLNVKKKKLFCVFVDFEKAFDFIHRQSLFFKLFKYNINGKFLRIIQNMYNDVKSRIVHNNSFSDTFACDIGVRQGENLSPLLFCLYLNDLQEFLENANITDVNSISSDIENELTVYLKIFLLLYADDTILLSESKENLQLLLDKFLEYCNKWKLKVNVDKTKIMIFSKGRIPENYKFYIQNQEIEIVKNYKYLGILFSRSGSFLATRKYLKEQGIKAMYSVLSKCRANHLSIECQLEMFDKVVVPILLYGSEVWGFENLDIIESVHLRFCKHILRLKQSTPNFMVLGELGRYPLSVKVKLRMVNFWCRLLDGNINKISYLLYKLANINYINYGFENKWICFMKSIFDNCGLSNIWLSQDVAAKQWIISSIDLRLKDQFKQNWFADMNISSKGLCYRIFKCDFDMEKYLSILPYNLATLFCKYRCGSHRLPVETGRWQSVARNERLCHLCDSSDIGDEFHYIMSCRFFANERKQLLPLYYCRNVNIIKFQQLFTSRSNSVLAKLCKFIRLILQKM